MINCIIEFSKMPEILAILKNMMKKQMAYQGLTIHTGRKQNIIKNLTALQDRSCRAVLLSGAIFFHVNEESRKFQKLGADTLLASSGKCKKNLLKWPFAVQFLHHRCRSLPGIMRCVCFIVRIHYRSAWTRHGAGRQTPTVQIQVF